MLSEKGVPRGAQGAGARPADSPAGARRANRFAPVALADRPAVVALAAGVAGALFVLARLAVVAKGDTSRFVMAGASFVDKAAAPAGLHVFASGYDGQFYYRLALDPADLARTAFGITLDAGFRVQRIGFSALSWAASAGRHPLVPDAMIAVNLAALTVLGYLGALIARDAGRRAAWGLLVPGFWGFLFSIGRDLPEVVASCFLVGGLVLLRRNRPVAAGLALAAAVLTLETTLDVAIAVFVVFGFEVLRGRRRPGRRDLAWVLPGAAFVGWQVVAWVATGVLPMRADTGDNIAAPLVNPIGATLHYLFHPFSATALVWLGELFVLGVVTLFAGWCLWRARVPAWEKVAWGISLLVALSLSRTVWYGTANFRGFEDLYVLSVIVLLGSRRRLWPVAALVAVAWGVTFAHYVVAM